ncbi:phospholipase D-like domain-containing protein [Psychroserpens ponticola]|uniref:Phospholipase D-like domain-containing protein n=1 Tax=Psychroserpens ponticola TaxID=2932268 RepID=A0ABY7RWU7_9FLAO|nr:phospholipase D-like domain-containing protein [Psychroserpens ponticola]WCO01318.1 phospholipase D-like domain-containing protein [Psychroserpens ponticola]
MIHKSTIDRKEKKQFHDSTDDNGYIQLLHSGEEYFLRLKKIIQNAQKEIHLQTYIFEDDETGNDIADCLKEAAQRNVKVYVLLDAYGSASLSDSFVQDLQQHGILIRFFSPLFSLNNFYIGRRMHHKVVVADGSMALIGGINIGNKYHGNANTEPWLDYAVQLYCPAAEDLQKLCHDYFFKKGSSKKILPVLHSAGDARIGVLQNDWLQGKTEVCDAYTRAISNAEKEIVIVASYFLPGSKLTKALKKACTKGIKTKVILAGISDVPLVRRATEHLYTSLLSHNIKIYEWNKSVVHGKAAMVDNKWSIVGSFNLNSLSCYGSIEMNVEIESVEFAKNLNLDFEKVISECSQITLETLRERSGMFKNLANWVSYQIVRTSMLFLTFLPHLRFLKNYRF